MIVETIHHPYLTPLYKLLTYPKEHHKSIYSDKKCYLLTLGQEKDLYTRYMTIFTSKRLENLRKDHILFIDFSIECNPKIITIIYDLLIDKCKIPTTNIILNCASHDMQNRIRLEAQKRNKPEILSQIYYFFEHRIKNVAIAESFIPSPKNISKLYLNLNRLWRPHRLTLIHLLKENNLLESGYNSFGENVRRNKQVTDLKDMIKFCQLRYDKLDLSDLSNTCKIFPLHLDTNDFFPNLAMVEQKNIDHYHSTSLFSLVTETNFDREHLIFLTEKTFKPILHKQPFIIAARNGHLKELRKLGYKTFDGIIDESYDEIVDGGQRLAHIIGEVKRLSSVNKEDFLKQCEPIIEYNYKLLLEKNNYIYYNSAV